MPGTWYQVPVNNTATCFFIGRYRYQYLEVEGKLFYRYYSYLVNRWSTFPTFLRRKTAKVFSLAGIHVLRIIAMGSRLPVDIPGSTGTFFQSFNRTGIFPIFHYTLATFSSPEDMPNGILVNTRMGGDQ